MDNDSNNKGLDSLPAELIFQIGSYLSISNYIELAYTSRKLHKFLIRNNIVRYMNKRLGFRKNTGSLVLFTYHNCASLPSSVRSILLNDFSQSFTLTRSSMVNSWSMIHALHLNTLFFEKILQSDNEYHHHLQNNKPLKIGDSNRGNSSNGCGASSIILGGGMDQREEHIKKYFLQKICHRVVLLNKRRAIRNDVKNLKTFRSVFNSLLDTRDLKLIENCLRYFGKPIDSYTLRFNDYDCKIVSTYKKTNKVEKRRRKRRKESVASFTRIPIAQTSNLRTKTKLTGYPSFIISCNEQRYRDESIAQVHHQLIQLLEAYNIHVELASDYYRKEQKFNV